MKGYIFVKNVRNIVTCAEVSESVPAVRQKRRGMRGAARSQSFCPGYFSDRKSACFVRKLYNTVKYLYNLFYEMAVPYVRNTGMPHSIA